MGLDILRRRNTSAIPNAIGNAGGILGEFFAQEAERKRAEDEQFRLEKDALQTQLTNILANPELPEENKLQIQGLVGNVAKTQSRGELDGILQNVQTTGTSPANTGLAEIFGAPQTAVAPQVIGNALAGINQQTRETSLSDQERADLQALLSSRVSALASDTTVSPQDRQRAVEGLLGSLPEGTVSSAYAEALKGLSGFQDLNAERAKGLATASASLGLQAQRAANDFNAEEYKRAETRFFLEERAGRQQLRLGEQQILQNDNTLREQFRTMEQSEKERVVANVLNAYNTGLDEGLDDQEKQALASFMGVIIDDQEGYKSALEVQRNKFQSLRDNEVKASKIGIDSANLGLQGQSLQLKAAEYSYDRQAVVDAQADELNEIGRLEFANNYLKGAIETYDVSEIDKLLYAKNNPGAGTAGQQALVSNYTVEQLQTAKELATRNQGDQEFMRNVALDKAKAEALNNKALSIETLATSFTPQQIGELSDPTSPSYDPQLASMFNYQDLQAAGLKSARRLALEKVESPEYQQAVSAYNDILERGIAPDQIESVGIPAIESQLDRMGIFDQATRNGLISSAINAWSVQGNKDAFDLAIQQSNIDLNRARINATYADTANTTALTKARISELGTQSQANVALANQRNRSGSTSGSGGDIIDFYKLQIAGIDDQVRSFDDREQALIKKYEQDFGPPLTMSPEDQAQLEEIRRLRSAAESQRRQIIQQDIDDPATPTQDAPPESSSGGGLNLQALSAALSQGISPEEIVKQLTARGVSEAEARAAISQVGNVPPPPSVVPTEQRGLGIPGFVGQGLSNAGQGLGNAAQQVGSSLNNTGRTLLDLFNRGGQ